MAGFTGLFGRLITLNEVEDVGPCWDSTDRSGRGKKGLCEKKSPTGFGRGVFISVLEECVATYKENGHQDCGPVDVVTRILVFKGARKQVDEHIGDDTHQYTIGDAVG